VYSLIRYVPDPARGEFVNVGAIAGSEDAGDWQVRQLQNPARARALGGRLTLDAVAEAHGLESVALADALS